LQAIRIKGAEGVLATIGPPAGKPGDPYQYEKAMKEIVRVMDMNGSNDLTLSMNVTYLQGSYDKSGIGTKFKFMK
jgi:hypothetical protein